MKMQPFNQGYLDCLCGIYSIINAEKFLNKTTEDNSQKLFNEIITFLAVKRKLRDTIIDGMNHRGMILLVDMFLRNRLGEIVTNRKGFLNLNEWWKYTKQFLEEKEGRAVILSLGGKRSHLTVIESMSDRSMKVLDSNWTRRIRKAECLLLDPSKEDQIDKYMIYPAQCFYLGIGNPLDKS